MNTNCKNMLTNIYKNSNSIRQTASEMKRIFSATIQYKKLSNYSTEQRGCLNDQSFRLYFKSKDNNIVSPFHDIPLHTDKDNIYNMVVEVPRWSNAKLEICTTEIMNPIKHDVKNGTLRYVANCFPHHGYLWNYGCLPQTWEDPRYVEIETNTKGDSDPIDVCEIGSRIHNIGSVIKVKLLGILCLIDEDETDWKILAIDINDPLAHQINNVHDIKKKMPGLIEATVNWYRVYKTPFGSLPNKFGFGAELQDVKFTSDIVNDVHMHWKKLMNTKSDVEIDIQRSCTVYDSPFRIIQSEAIKSVKSHLPKGDAKPYDMDVNKWCYIENNM